MNSKAVAVGMLAFASLAGAATSGHAQGYKQIYSFRGKHGAAPYAGLTAFKGKLYGVTSEGGSKNCRHGCGVVFSIDIATGREKVIYSFLGGADGFDPTSNLTAAGGLLYGTTQSGGTYGTVFSLDPGTGTKIILHGFGGGADGMFPSGPPLVAAGVLYGETGDGGSGSGVVYAIDLTTGVEQVVYAFQSSRDGMSPIGGLIEIDKVLYGTTYTGGYFGNGTVFSINLAKGAEKVLHSFKEGQDGLFPAGGLIQVGDRLYGTTQIGGAFRGGTVFSIDPATGDEGVIYSFGSAHGVGARIDSGLVYLQGLLYGTSYTGGSGSCACGTIFSVNVATQVGTVLYSFQNGGTDGELPSDSLTDLGGNLYGTTQAGGSGHSGTVFSYTP